MSLKPPYRGVCLAGSASIPAAMLGSVNGTSVYFTWRELEATNMGGTLNGPGLSRITNQIAYCQANNKIWKMRLFTNGAPGGTTPRDGGAPAWVKADAAIPKFRHMNSQDQNPYTAPALLLCAYWSPRWKTLYTRFINALGVLLDGEPTLEDVTISYGMMLYAEPLILDINGTATNPANTSQTFNTGLANRHELVGGGTGYGTGALGYQNPVNIPVPGAGFTDAKHMQAMKDGIDAHTAAFPNTYQSFSFNPYQTINADATASSEGVTLTKTKQLVDYLAAKTNATLENNSARPEYFTYSGGVATGYTANNVMASLYQYFATKPRPVFIQCANSTQIPNTQFPTVKAALDATMSAVINVIGASGCEPTEGFPSYETAAAVLAWNTGLAANWGASVPATPPSNTQAPSISPSGSSPVGTILQSSPGGWSGTLPMTPDYQWQQQVASSAGAVILGAATHLRSGRTTRKAEMDFLNSEVSPGRIGWNRDYDALGWTHPNSDQQSMLNAGYGLFITFGDGGNTWDSIGNSTAHDAALNALGDGLVAADPGGTKIIVGFQHEPEKHLGSGNTPATYVAACKKFHDRIRARGATQKIFCVLQGQTFRLNSGTDHTVSTYDPGPSYCDGLGVDAYNWFQKSGNWLSFAQVYAPYLNWMAQHRPTYKQIIGEVATDDDPNNVTRKATWITDMLADLKLAKWSNLVGVFWFNSVDQKGGYYWYFDASNTCSACVSHSIAAMKTISQDAYFQGGSGTTSYVNIGGATAPTFDTTGYLGKLVRVGVRETNSAGTSSRVYSLPAGPFVAGGVAPGWAVGSVPKITGTAVVGSTLGIDIGTTTGSPSPSASYQWYDSATGAANTWTPLAGETGPTMLLDSGDVGHWRQVRVTLTNGVAPDAVKFTAGIGPVSDLPPKPPLLLGLPVIQVTGVSQPTEGVAVRAVLDASLIQGTPPFTYGWQWIRCYPNGDWVNPIPGEVGESYTPTIDDVGFKLRVVVVVTNSVDSASAQSLPTSLVVAAGPPPPPPPPPGTSAVQRSLGCGLYDVMIHQRGGEVIRHQLTAWTAVKWSRVDGAPGSGAVDLSGLSAADLAKCCESLSDVLPWADELALYRRRDNEVAGTLIWTGPIGDPQLSQGKAEIPASDLLAWFDVRFVHHDSAWADQDLADIAIGVMRDALDPDPSPGITVDHQGCGIKGSLAVLASDYATAGEKLRSLVEQGLRLSCMRRTVLASGAPETPLTFTDSSFAAPPQILLRGSGQATRVAVTGQQPPTADMATTTDVPAPQATSLADTATVETYGLIERASQTDSTTDRGVAGDAERWIAEASKPIGIVESGVLNPDVGMTLDDLVAGRRCRVRLVDECYHVDGMYRLSLVEGEATSGTEKITVHFVPLDGGLA